MRAWEVRCGRESAGIYIVVNVVTGDFYIGCSWRIRKRWYEHLRAMTTGRHTTPKMNQLCRRYGPESFRFAMLERMPRTSENMDRIIQERRWMKALKPTLNTERWAR